MNVKIKKRPPERDHIKSEPDPSDGNVLVEHDRTMLEARAELRCGSDQIWNYLFDGELTAYDRNGRTMIEGPSITAMRDRHRMKPEEFRVLAKRRGASKNVT